MEAQGNLWPVLFPLGRLFVTLKAAAVLAASGEEAASFLSRHATGDWGGACERDRAANLLAVAQGGPIRSSYSTATGATLWVVTAGDRSETCILLAGEV